LQIVAASNAWYGGLDFNQSFPGEVSLPPLAWLNSKFIMMPPRRTNPRTEHRLREIERANNSVSLAEKFPRLRSLMVDLLYFDTNGITKNGELKYKVNVQHAKSVFSFVCPNGECVGGDFDLSDAVTQAVTTRRKTVEGEIRCQGVRARPKMEKMPCHNLLRYKLTLGYV
jgi:hypothetical protein